MSGGTWSSGGDLSLGLGNNAVGVLNLTGSGAVTVGSGGSGTVSLTSSSTASGTLNLGTGGTAGTLNAATINGGSGTAVVNFNHTGSYAFAPALTGNLSVNKLGSGTTTLSTANSYTGATSVNGGTLALAFGAVSSDIISSSSALTLGGGALSLTGTGTQTFNGLTTTASTGSGILLGASQTLTLGALTAAGGNSALNFNTAAGGADGATVGGGVVVLTGQTAGTAISPGFTVTDSTGFGLATVNGSDQVVRMATASLLPASGASSGTDYQISTSSSLTVTSAETAHSLTVDTTAASSVLTLSPGAVLSSDTLNIGGVGSHTWQITSGGSGAGITSATAGGTLNLNNYNTGLVTLVGPILDNSTTAVNVQGTGTTEFTTASSYTGQTTVSQGVLQVDANNALGTTGSGTTVKSGASLQLNNVNYSSAEALSINGNGSGGGALLNSGTSTYAGQVTATTNASISAGGGTLNLTGGVVKNGTTLTLTGGGQVNVSGTGISGSSPNSDLVVDGTTVVISAASTYNGPTTVQNGGVLVANAAINGSGNFTVNSGSTLSGTSTITTGAGSYIYINGRLEVGDSTLGTPVASSLALATSSGGAAVMGATGLMDFNLFQHGGDLSATVSAADYLSLTGTLDATLGTLTLENASHLSGFAAGDSWKLFDLSQGSVTGSFAHVDYSALSLGSGLAGSFNNSTGIFSIVAVAPAPEPGRAVLMLLGLGGVMLRRRRRA